MINRQKQAVVRGYQARIDGVSIDKNYYATLSNKYSSLAGHWEKGWLMADSAFKDDRKTPRKTNYPEIPDSLNNQTKTVCKLF